MNPVARVIHYGHYSNPDAKMDGVMVWCPGCDQRHVFNTYVSPDYPARPDGSAQPVWEWDGNLEAPTFSPSLLCYYTVHRCTSPFEHVECNGKCGARSHSILWKHADGSIHQYKVHQKDQIPDDAVEIIGHTYHDHNMEPPFGNCHSFLKNGVWEFLDDCAHSLRGQHPMVPLPIYELGDDE